MRNDEQGDDNETSKTTKRAGAIDAPAIFSMTDWNQRRSGVHTTYGGTIQVKPTTRLLVELFISSRDEKELLNNN